MQHIPIWQANSSSSSQEIPRILCNPKVHYRVHKRPPPASILSQINPIHPLTHFLQIHFNIIIPSMPGSCKLSPSLRPLRKNSVCSPPLPHTCYILRPSPWLYHPKSLFVIRSLLLQLHDDRTWACLAVRRINNSTQYHIAVHELHRSRFRRFVAGSNESGWITWLDSRFTPSSCNCVDHSQLGTILYFT